MANSVHHVLNEMELNEEHAIDALRAILHTILFTRSMGKVSMHGCTTTSLNGVVYPHCADHSLDASLDEAITTFTKCVHIVGPDLYRGQMHLSFFETLKSDGFLGMKSESKVVWEKWTIPLVIGTLSLQPPEDSVKANLLLVLQICNKVNHIPKFVPVNGSVIYQYEIASTDNRTPGMLKQLLSHGNSLRFHL